MSEIDEVSFRILSMNSGMSLGLELALQRPDLAERLLALTRQGPQEMQEAGSVVTAARDQVVAHIIGTLDAYPTGSGSDE